MNTKYITATVAIVLMVGLTGIGAAVCNGDTSEHQTGYISPPHTLGEPGITMLTDPVPSSSHSTGYISPPHRPGTSGISISISTEYSKVDNLNTPQSLYTMKTDYSIMVNNYLNQNHVTNGFIYHEYVYSIMVDADQTHLLSAKTAKEFGLTHKNNPGIRQ